MTHLVERITLTLTLHRDEQPDFPYDNPLGLNVLPPKGRQRLGPITYEWERHGLEEIAEVTGSDN